MGITIAIIGASLAVALSCVGSGKGVGMVGEASSGVLAEDPSKFSACLILQIMPGTQGLYGLVIWFFAMLQLGVLGGSPMELTTGTGLCLSAGLPAHGSGRLLHRHRTGSLRRFRCRTGGKACGRNVQGHRSDHHGRILRHPLPAGFLPDDPVPDPGLGLIDTFPYRYGKEYRNK